MNKYFTRIVLLTMITMSACSQAWSQPVVSPEISDDSYITWRLHAPSASEVLVSGNDLPYLEQPMPMKNTGEGYWELTLGPVAPGAYRYSFIVDGATVLDYRNTQTSESNNNAWSLALVPGDPVMDMQNVAHGLVAEVNYHSEALGRSRRMHVYTPAGYGTGQEHYPVLYLLHGAMDSDDSWSTVGRAAVIFDNLIANGRIKPMVVVMPAGHTTTFRMGESGLPIADFASEFTTDIRPWAEQNLRILGGSANTAIAGLSMGGAQTLEIAFNNLSDFGYVGVFSSGVFGIVENDEWQQQRLTVLNDTEARANQEIFWFATGTDDFLIETTRSTVDMFKQNGFDVTYQETEGGHTWFNWREYLQDFTVLLFQ